MPERITLPETLSPSSLDVLHRAVRGAASSPDPLVLSGSCRGMDLEAFAGGDLAPNLQRFADLLFSLRSAQQPTIALLDGQTSGGGVGIAACCDVVVCSPRSTFSLPEALFGLLPGVVIPALSQRMSPHAIVLLAATGVSRDSAWAAGAGLVDEVAEDLERAEARWARGLSRVERRRLPELREWASLSRTIELRRALEQGAERTLRAASDPAVRERARAFVRDGEAPWQR